MLRHLTQPRPAVALEANEPLSERELEVVRLVAGGCANQEVAAELFVSLPTVKTHVASIFAELGARNRVGVAAWAWESGVMG
ncbi:response regulator transcription factor [Nonomuraea sp. NPDC050394]|uniref:response regulator transcription factor n=1 Tax=Nonomuraea sp. NPDC050394 TaxID=3364363 RepID=UPI0037BA4E6D